MSTENNNAEVAATAAVSIKLPDFWKNDPVMWFAQAEAQFALGRVVNDETKYYHIIGKVDQTVICHISDLVVAPPADNKYAAVKERLISRFVLSAETRLERLLGSYELGDLRPTHLLAKMRELAIGLKVDDNLLKMLFIQRLPVNVRPILSCHDGTLDKLAEMADKMVGVTSSLTTAAVDNAAGPSGASGLQEQKHYYQPMFTLIGGGIKTLNDSYRPMAKVLPALAKWLKDSAVKFEPENNAVYTANGDKIEYDFLLVAVGLQLNYDKIPGLVEALSIPKGKVCSNYSPKYVDRTFEALKAFKSGNAIFTYPNSPVKCPGAPQKILYIAEHYLRNSKKRQNANVTYNSSLPVIFGVKHYADQLWKIVEKRNINVNLRTNLIEVLPEKNQAVFQNLDKPEEKFTTDYEFLHVTPPMSAPDALSACKDLVTDTGFVNVDKDTLQHLNYSNVFAIGDCSASPNSKTAASVAAQSKVVSKNMIAVMNGVRPGQVFDGYASCPLVTGYNTCILAEFDYSLTPLETFPIDQSKERISMFYMKKDIMPPLYWHLLLNGLWNGPGFARKLMHFKL